MTAPTTRTVAGLEVPLPLAPRIIEAIRARYAEATAGIADPDAATRAALKAWVIETLADYEHAKALQPLDLAIAQTVTTFETKAEAARQKALTDGETIRDAIA